MSTQQTSAVPSWPSETVVELNTSLFSRGLIWLYAMVRGFGAATCRRWLLRILSGLEGGEMRSASLRRIFSRVHDVEIGAHAYGCFDSLRIPRGTRIGRYVSVGPGVSAYRRNHPSDRLSLHPYFYSPAQGAAMASDVATEPLVISADAWIGANALILPGCQRIGRGAVVAAGAVVTRDIPDYAVAGGNPARVIRYRFADEQIHAANQTRWWNCPPEHAARVVDMARPFAPGAPASGRSEVV